MEISPFRGIRYNREIIGDMAWVICPPYDVISPNQQEFYYGVSDYNAIRLEHPLPDRCQLPNVNYNDKYSMAATTLRQWLRQGVLEIDDCPSFYLHDQYFDYLGTRRVRRGLVARVALEPWGSGIYPHEETFPKAKDDRLKLMRACRANFSPLFSLYHDSEQKITSILSEVARGKPIIDVAGLSPLMRNGEGGERHVVWAITDPETKNQLGGLLSTQTLSMADGHHRYETALTYQLEQSQARRNSKIEQPLTGKEAFNYIMMELVEFSDPGLLVLPIYRLVRGISPSSLAGLEKQLDNFFTLEFITLTDTLFASSNYDKSEPRVKCEGDEALSELLNGAVLGVLGLKAGFLVLLRERRNLSLGNMVTGDHPQVYKQFSVSLLNHVILDRLPGFAASEGDIVYTESATEAYRRIQEGEYQLAFLLNPPQTKIVKAFADAKAKMPGKSTYFYPKLPTGLIINLLD